MNAKEETFARNKTENQEFQNLKQDLDVLRKDLAKLSSSLLTDAKSGAEHMMEGLNEKSSRAVKQAETKIGERPFLSLLVTFILGLVVAKALDRGNH